jgi:hypothetical protein
MTHGEQTKAKAAKTSQASGSKKISSKAGGKAVQSGKSGKASAKETGEGGKAAKIVVKKDQPGAPKGSSSAEKSSSAAASKAGGSAKEAGNGGKGSGKARPAAVPADATSGFTNPTIANAFKRAVKKYPNAFRKLTD